MATERKRRIRHRAPVLAGVDAEQDVDPGTDQLDAVLAGAGVGEQSPQAGAVCQKAVQRFLAVVGVADEVGESRGAALLGKAGMRNVGKSRAVAARRGG
jgi:hypothetical protein